MIEVQYLGQNGFVVAYNGKKLCFDLYLSNCVFELTGTGRRNYEAPIDIQELADIDYYFISHDHLDHLDPQTIQAIARVASKVKFICPYPYEEKLVALGIDKTAVIKADAYSKIVLEDIEIYPVAEKHEDYAIIDGHHGNLGYCINLNGFKIYHAGDAIADKKLADDLKEYGSMDMMFLPINGHDWKRFSEDTMGNMNYREALDLCSYVGTELVVPMHYDLFSNNTENPAYFVDYLYRTYPTQKFKMFIPGEKIIINA